MVEFVVVIDALLSMLASHASPKRMANWPDSWHIATKEPCLRAIIFVHGFNGSPVTTWEYIQGLLTDEEAFAETDFYYYGYDSRRQQLEFSTQELYRFVSEIAIVNPDDLTLVGHSIGGLLVRRVLVHAIRNSVPWVEKSKMVLIAPAQCGARITELLRHALSSPTIFRLFASAYLVKSPILGDIEEKSDAITDLKQDVEKLIDAKTPGASPHAILVPRVDLVVHQRSLKGDPEFIPVEHTDHCRIAKANGRHDERFIKLIQCLQ